MAEKSITLRADLVEHLEQMAIEQGRSLDDVVEDLLTRKARNPLNSWAVRLAEGMAEADIDWKEPSSDKSSRELYEENLEKRWLGTQQTEKTKERSDD